MAWNSPLTRWFAEHPVLPEPGNRAVAAAPEKTEKRSYSLSDPALWRYFNLGSANLAGVSVDWRSALGVSAFASALGYISSGVAMLDRRVVGDAENGPVEKREHPLWRFFAQKPHPHYTWFDFISALLVNACFGNGYARIHWDFETMRPVYLEHIPFFCCRPEYDSAGGLWYRVSGILNGCSVSEMVASVDIIHIKGLSLDGVCGLDTVLVHQSTLAVGIARGQYAESKLGKSVFPSIVVSTDEELDATQVATREANLIDRVGSAQRAGTPIYLDAGQKLEYNPPPTLDAALQQLATLNVEDVCRITKVPRDLLALDTHGTYGAGVQRSKDFLLHCLSPWIEKIQEEFSDKLFYYSESRRKSAYFQFDTSMYLALDEAEMSKVLVEEVKGTIRTPNEARAAKGLPPLDGGDELMVDVNLLPVSQAVKIAYAKYLAAEGEKAVGGDRLTGEETPGESSQNTTQKGEKNEQ